MTSSGTMWDCESTKVKDIVGRVIDLVFYIEPTYYENFKRSYPKAKHILIETERTNFIVIKTL